MDNRLDAYRQQALEFAGIGLYQYRFDGTLLAIDRGAMVIFGLDGLYPDPTTIVGKNISELINYIYPPGTLRGLVREHGHIHNLELNLLTLRGENRWISHDAQIIQDAETGEEAVQVIIQDVTTRKRAQEALRQAYAEMELKVQERTASEREQRLLAEALIDIASLLNSTLQLDEVLDNILSEIQKVVPHDSASIMLVKDGEAQVMRDSSSKKRKNGQGFVRSFTLDELPVEQRMLVARHAVLIEDIQSHSERFFKSDRNEKIRSFLGVPIRQAGETIGFINLFSYHPGFFNGKQAERLQAFSDQAAIAIHNARSYTRAKELASLEERQSLARDLHDSVSQTLWTTTLITHVLPENLENNPEEGRRNIAQLQRLTTGALAEMRMLLLELRSSALEEAQLKDLLDQLSQSIMSRKDIDINLVIEGEAPIPNEIKIGFYRLAQEALNNVVKHARATLVNISLTLTTSSIELIISDNGRGFDILQDLKGLGLNIMRERAEAIDAAFTITSQAYMGTQIKVTWPTGQISTGKT